MPADQDRSAIKWWRGLPLRIWLYMVMFLMSWAFFLGTGRWGFVLAGLGWQATMLIAAWRHEHNGRTEADDAR